MGPPRSPLGALGVGGGVDADILSLHYIMCDWLSFEVHRQKLYHDLWKASINYERWLHKKICDAINSNSSNFSNNSWHTLYSLHLTQNKLVWETEKKKLKPIKTGSINSVFYELTRSWGWTVDLHGLLWFSVSGWPLVWFPFRWLCCGH